MRKILLFIFALILFMPASLAIERLNFGQGFISDNANIISKKDKAIINAFLLDLHEKTTTDFAVVSVKSLQDQKVEDTALHIAKAFKLGAIGKDNGAVLVVAPKEKKAAIYVGYDFDEAVSPERREQIISKYFSDDFDSKNISENIYKASTIISADIGKFYNVHINGLDYSIVPSSPVSKATKYSIFYYILSAILFIAALLVCRLKKNRRFDLSTDFAFGGKLKNAKTW